MYGQLTALLRRNHSTIAALSLRDLPLQVCTGLAACVVAWQLGFPLLAGITAALILLSEASLFAILKTRWPFTELTRDTAALSVLIGSMANVTLYALPAAALAAHPSLAIKIAAITWITGMLIFILTSWPRVPLFLYALLIPTFAMLAAAFVRLSFTAPEPATLGHWGVAVGVLTVFIYVALNTVRQQLQTAEDLRRSQTESAQRLRLLEYAQRIDPLTGVLSRGAFDTALSVMLSEHQDDPDGDVAVFILDLDHFKPINDAYTHPAGDRVLIETAKRLQTRVGTDGIVGRLGGDEFICAMQIERGAMGPDAVARCLQAAVGDPINWEGRSLRVAASIGVAVTGLGNDSPPAEVSALCAAADRAMFRAKASPTGLPMIFRASTFPPRPHRARSSTPDHGAEKRRHSPPLSTQNPPAVRAHHRL